MSVIEYNSDRIELLEKKAEKYDALCELVEALREANKIDRELEAVQDQRINRLEDKLYDLRRKLYSDVD
jgi:HD superfamily phosphodiesterase